MSAQPKITLQTERSVVSNIQTNIPPSVPALFFGIPGENRQSFGLLPGGSGVSTLFFWIKKTQKSIVFCTKDRVQAKTFKIFPTILTFLFSNSTIAPTFAVQFLKR